MVFININCSEDIEGKEANSPTGSMFFSVYFFLICTCSLTENTIILLAIIRVKRLHKRRNILIFNLAVTDLVAGVIYPSCTFFTSTFMESIGFIVGIVSNFTILAIATERFLKIVVYTKSRNAYMGTTRQLVGASIIAWVIPSFTCLLISFYDDSAYVVFSLTFGPLCIFAVLVAISVLYLAIYVKIKSHDKRMHTNLNRTENYNLTKLVLKAYVVIVVVYAICFLPWAIESLRMIYTMYYKIADEESHCIFHTLAFCIGVAMVMLNSTVNPIIYWLRLPDFREGIPELFGYCKTENTCCYKRSVVNNNSCSRNRTTDLAQDTVLYSK